MYKFYFEIEGETSSNLDVTILEIDPCEGKSLCMDYLDEDNPAKMKPHIRMVTKDKDNPPGSSGILVPEREFDKRKLDLIIGKHEFNALPETIKELSRKLWYGVENWPSWKSDKTSNYFLVVDGKAVHF